MTHDEHTHDDHLADGSIDAGEKPEQSERSDTSDTSEKTPAFRSGFVALVGRPNVGKSTLINACMNKRLAITSPVAQTTRRRLRCILTDEDSQIIMVDTPGLHKPKDALGNQLNKTALASLADVDAVALLNLTFDELLAAQVDTNTANFLVCTAHIWASTHLECRFKAFEYYLSL